jgi:hypothetical protein
MTVTPERSPEQDEMRRSYLRVLVVWILTLAGLFALQEYFS